MKVHLTTLGCPKNQVDSELMLGMLTEAGFPLVEQPEDAECLIVNTCAFIDRAREESVDTILELAKLKERGSCRALIVTGCLTQRYGGDILKEMPEIDGILGTANLSRIVELVRQAAGRHDWATSAPPGYLYDATTPRLLTGRVPYAYLKIAEGCDMGCTFCAIPQFRGRHRSRPLADVVKEVEGLAARGVQEAILVSQDTLAYGRDLPVNGDIAELLLALGRRGDAVARVSRPGRARGGGGTRGHRAGISGPTRLGARRRACRCGDGRPGGRPQRGSRVRVGGEDRWPGTRDRRGRVPPRPELHAGLRARSPRGGGGIGARRRGRIAGSPR